jgi:phosphoribosylformylglycinamidine cyclo-ligase
LFFLDYFASGRLEPDMAKSVVEGIVEGCRRAGCALIGGETAELPGLYADGDYDLAGFAVGAVERGKQLTGASVAKNDILLGLASDGPHSNGFSLIRRVAERAGLDYAAAAPFAPEISLGEALLTPTRIYVKSCLAAIRAAGVRALAHVTGGGLIENLPRVLPDDLAARIDRATWPEPPVFRWLAEEGDIARDEMDRTFNIGIGMVVVVAPDAAGRLRSVLEDAGETVYEIGRIVSRENGAAVTLEN